MYETQNLLSLLLVSFLVGLRTYQHLCILNVFADSNRYRLMELLLFRTCVNVSLFPTTDYFYSACFICGRVMLNYHHRINISLIGPNSPA
jgi:hypothetical protein